MTMTSRLEPDGMRVFLWAVEYPSRANALSRTSYSARPIRLSLKWRDFLLICLSRLINKS
jgi:hypothetical protein